MTNNTKSLIWLVLKILGVGIGVALWFFMASLLLGWFGLAGGMAWNVFSALSFIVWMNHFKRRKS